jgi:hypothetical protein
MAEGIGPWKQFSTAAKASRAGLRKTFSGIGPENKFLLTSTRRSSGFVDALNNVWNCPENRLFIRVTS